MPTTTCSDSAFLTTSPHSTFSFRAMTIGNVRLEVQPAVHGVTISLTDESMSHTGSAPGRRLCDLDLSVRPQVSLRCSLGLFPNQLFDPSRAKDKPLDWMFETFLAMAGKALQPVGKRSRSIVEPMWELLLEIQHLLEALLVPHAREAAWRFPSRHALRWSMYRLAASDETGRVSQCSETCPGLLLLILALEGREPSAAREIIEMIVSGMKRGKILTRAADLWGEVVQASPGMRRNQYFRIKHARHLVPLEKLWIGAAGPVIVEDIPRIPELNQQWFVTMPFAEEAAERLTPGLQRESFLAFISRTSVELEELLKPHDQCISSALRWLTDFLIGTGRQPSRETNPRELVAACDTWHRRPIARKDTFPDDHPLSLGPAKGFELWKNPRSVIRFLSTVGELARESEVMDHCVVAHARMAVEGKVQIFHGEFDREQGTIEISCEKGEPVLLEAKGVRNETLSVRAQWVIGLWLADLRKVVAGIHAEEAV